MAESEVEFRSGVIKPVECIKAGWELVKPDYWVFFGITAIGALIGSFGPMGILWGPMLCGIYYCFLNAMDGKEVRLENLFKGFDYFLPGFIVVLIQMGIMFILMIPLYIILVLGFIAGAFSAGAGRNAPSAAPAFGISLFVLYFVLFLGIWSVSILVSVIFQFTFPLIVDQKLGAIDSIKVSFRGVKANFKGVILLVLLVGVLTLAGVICCYIGAFFVMPVCFASIAYAYRQVFPKVEIGEASE